MNNSLFFFAALGILLWFAVFLYLKSYIKRRTGTEQMLRSLREEIRLLEAGIDLKTEQSLGLLEERIESLRELMRTMEELRRETERRIAVYVRELDRRKAQDTAFAALSGPSFPESPPSAEKAVSRRKKKTGGASRDKANSLLASIEVRELNAAHAIGSYQAQSVSPADTSESPDVMNESSAQTSETPLAVLLEPARTETIPPDENEAAARPRFIRPPVSVVPAAPPLRERIAELYRAGFSEDLIAARLGITITEARLYMAMTERPETP
jgi:hypothetical protein